MPKATASSKKAPLRSFRKACHFTGEETAAATAAGLVVGEVRLEDDGEEAAEAVESSVAFLSSTSPNLDTC